jgi:hypothetical protein
MADRGGWHAHGDSVHRVGHLTRPVPVSEVDEPQSVHTDVQLRARSLPRGSAELYPCHRGITGRVG